MRSLTLETTAPLGRLDFLAGGGEMGAACAGSTGPPPRSARSESWPQSLRTAVSICLSSRFPMFLWWGPELVMLYNDAYRRCSGASTRGARAGRARECWPEIWDVIGPMLGAA